MAEQSNIISEEFSKFLVDSIVSQSRKTIEEGFFDFLKEKPSSKDEDIFQKFSDAGRQIESIGRQLRQDISKHKLSSNSSEEKKITDIISLGMQLRTFSPFDGKKEEPSEAEEPLVASEVEDEREPEIPAASSVAPPTVHPVEPATQEEETPIDKMSLKELKIELAHLKEKHKNYTAAQKKAKSDIDKLKYDKVLRQILKDVSDVEEQIEARKAQPETTSVPNPTFSPAIEPEDIRSNEIISKNAKAIYYKVFNGKEFDRKLTELMGDRNKRNDDRIEFIQQNPDAVRDLIPTPILKALDSSSIQESVLLFNPIFLENKREDQWKNREEMEARLEAERTRVLPIDAFDWKNAAKVGELTNAVIQVVNKDPKVKKAMKANLDKNGMPTQLYQERLQNHFKESPDKLKVLIKTLQAKFNYGNLLDRYLTEIQNNASSTLEEQIMKLLKNIEGKK